MVKNLRLGRLATDLPNHGLPVYGWFPLKEAFSRDLVVMLLRSLWMGKGDRVLDPFCGKGTTLLACKELGVDAVGYEVHPLFLFLSRVELRDYDLPALRRAGEEVLSAPFRPPSTPPPKLLQKFFHPGVLQDLLFFREEILRREGTERDFLLTALMLAAVESSWAFKDGEVLKVRKGKITPLREALARRIGWMCDDLEKLETRRADLSVVEGDAREMEVEEESFDAVITSPPYPGKLEYARAYRLEQEILGLPPPRPEKLLGVRTRGGEPEFDQEAYLEDLSKVVEKLYLACVEGGEVAMVVSDGCFPEERKVFEVCTPVCEIAEKAGFKVRKAIIVNERFCTTPSRKKLGVMREYLLQWRK
ncbi:MAG: class I SAM-dependent methyltransferase [Candidatus Hadarchaeales archaeon]